MLGGGAAAGRGCRAAALLHRPTAGAARGRQAALRPPRRAVRRDHRSAGTHGGPRPAGGPPGDRHGHRRRAAGALRGVRLTAATAPVHRRRAGQVGGPPARFPLVAHGGRSASCSWRRGAWTSAFPAAETALLRDLADQAALAAVEAGRSAVDAGSGRATGWCWRARRNAGGSAATCTTASPRRWWVRGCWPRWPAGPSGRRPAPPLLASLGAELEACSAEVRSLIDGLRPAALDRGLAPALHRLVGRFGEGAEAPAVTLVVDGDLDRAARRRRGGGLPGGHRGADQRGEARAAPRAVQIEVHRDARHLDLRIVDDGVGLGGRQLGAGHRRRPVVDARPGRGAGRPVRDRPGRDARHPGRAAAARRWLT